MRRDPTSLVVVITDVQQVCSDVLTEIGNLKQLTSERLLLCVHPEMTSLTLSRTQVPRQSQHGDGDVTHAGPPVPVLAGIAVLPSRLPKLQRLSLTGIDSVEEVLKVTNAAFCVRGLFLRHSEGVWGSLSDAAKYHAQQMQRCHGRVRSTSD